MGAHMDHNNFGGDFDGRYGMPDGMFCIKEVRH